MPYKECCIFNEEVQEKIYNLYRGSDLEVLEYLVSILPQDERAKEFLNKYLAENPELDDQDTDRVNIFWEVMDYYGMTEIINQKEAEL